MRISVSVAAVLITVSVGCFSVACAADTAQQAPACPINVTAYGAACNGSADDTVALNQALAACGGACKSVRILAGTCIISAPLKVPSNCDLGGAGSATVIQKKSGASLPPSDGLIENADLTRGNSGIAIHDLTVVGEGSSVTPYGIYLELVHNARISSVTLKDILNHNDGAIDVDSSDHFSILGCVIRKSSNVGIRVSSNIAPSTDFAIEGNHVTDVVQSDGIFVAMTGHPAKHASSRFTILRNVVRNVNDVAIEVGAAGDGKAQHTFWRVEDNKIYDSPTGILIRNASHGSVQHNFVSGCGKGSTTGGIAIYAGEANITDVKVVGNTVQNYVSNGLRVAIQRPFRPSGLTITENTFSSGEHGVTAILFYGYCGHSVVRHNSISTTPGQRRIILNNILEGSPDQCVIEDPQTTN
jgi:hypothetical protein